MINWTSEQSDILLNPRMPLQQRQQLESILEFAPQLKGHLWLCTSGSTSLKLVALSKEALLISAEAVNQHLNSNASDVWVNPLPIFHVGGLSILARCYISGAKYFSFHQEWNPLHFHQMLRESSATLTAMVPAQIFDLLKEKLRAPTTLRAAIVGGGGLSRDLFVKAKELGWKLLPSYGMTETASQIATVALEDLDDYPQLKILPHMSLTHTADDRICIKSKSLLTTYAIENSGKWQLIDPKVDQVFITEDMGKIEGDQLQIIGRCTDFIKIGGESVHLLRLENLLEALKLRQSIKGDVALVALPDARLGHSIHLAAAAEKGEAAKIFAAFNQEVMPFEKIRQIHYLCSLPRSPLGKLLKQDLLHQCTNELQKS